MTRNNTKLQAKTTYPTYLELAADGRCLAHVPDLYRTFAFPWGVAGTPHEWVSIFIRHDREHAHDLREALSPDETTERTEAA